MLKDERDAARGAVVQNRRGLAGRGQRPEEDGSPAGQNKDVQFYTEVGLPHEKG